MASNPVNPFAAALNWQRESLDAMSEALDTSRVAPDRLETMESVEVGQTPSDVVYEENKLELLHYDPEAAGIDVPEEEREEIPILIVYALINRPYILDLQPDRSVVRRLLEAGHDVYLIKWNEPSRLDQHLTLDDYVDRYIENCVDVVRERSGQDAIDILGYCMGGTMSVMYAALHPEKVNALGLMAAGLCFDNTGGILEEWGAGEYYDPEDVTDTFGNVPSEFLDVGFALMDPVDNYVSKYVRLAENLENEEFVENFGRMERWLSEGVDVAGEAYVEFLEKIYQNNDLYENRLEIGGKRIDLENVDMPVLQLVGEYDHLIPPHASLPFNDAVGSDDVTTIEYSTGHIGLSVSSSSHEDVWPEAAAWFSGKNRQDVAIEIEEDEETAQAAAEAVESVESEENEADQREASEQASGVPESGANQGSEDEHRESSGDEGAASAEGSTADTSTPEADEDDVGAEPQSLGGEEPDTTADEITEGQQDQADVETIDGIGPTYADRLRSAGIETVADLREADPVEIAEITQTSPTRAQDWIDRT